MASRKQIQPSGTHHRRISDPNIEVAARESEQLEAAREHRRLQLEVDATFKIETQLLK